MDFFTYSIWWGDVMRELAMNEIEEVGGGALPIVAVAAVWAADFALLSAGYFFVQGVVQQAGSSNNGGGSSGGSSGTSGKDEDS